MYIFDAIVTSTEINVGEALWSRNNTHGSGRVCFMLAQGPTREGVGSEGGAKLAVERNEGSAILQILHMSNACV